MAGNLTARLAAFGVSLGAAAGAAWLVAPAEFRAALGLGAGETAPAKTTGGWGTAAAPAPEPPLIDLSALKWMAWTPETGAFFLFILACLALMTGLELTRPGGNPRRGALGLETTRGDRLFMSLLGSAWILLAWLGVMGTPLWGGLAIALAWSALLFWKA